jgi:hypothetical protein
MQYDCNTLRVKVKEKKLSLCMTQRHNGRVEVRLNPFLTLALKEVSHQLNSSGYFTPREKTWYLPNRRLYGPKASLDILKKTEISCPCQEMNPGSSP